MGFLAALFIAIGAFESTSWKGLVPFVIESEAQAAPNIGSGPNSLLTAPINTVGGIQSVGSITVVAIGTPSAGSVVNIGTAGSTTYTYACVAQDINGLETIPSATFTTTTGNATLSATNFNRVFCGGQAGAVAYRILKADTAHKIGVCFTQPNQACSFDDNSTSAGTSYTALTVDQTGSITSGAITTGNSALQENTLGTSITTVTCQSQTAFTVTGATTNMGCVCSWNGGVPASNPTAAILECFTSANTLTPVLCNPTAASVTPTATSINCRIVP